MAETREKLIELLVEAAEYEIDTCMCHDNCEGCIGRKYGRRCSDYLIADHLISIGVTAPVRCKDCKHCDPESKHCDHPMGTALPLPRKADDFCSYGERRTDA